MKVLTVLTLLPLLVMAHVSPHVSTLLADEIKVTKLVLVDASSDANLFTLLNNDEIVSNRLPGGFHIQAETFPNEVGSVCFYIDLELQKIENVHPYTFGGGHYNQNDFSETNLESLGIQKGQPFLITAAPYTGEMCEGDQGNSQTIYLTIL